METVAKADNLFNISTNPVSGFRALTADKPSGGPQPSEALSAQESEAAIERKRLLSEQLARTRAARRGGYRALLSQQRLTPETGLQTTLGVG